MKKLTAILICVILLMNITFPVYAIPKVNTTLNKLNWDEDTYERLNDLIAKYSINNDNYDMRNKPYAVFDFDNTTAMNDVAEATMIYQLENLEFSMTPETLSKTFRTNVPKTNFAQEFWSSDGSPLNIDIVMDDITESYTWIYNNYKKMKGDLTLSEVKQNPNYQEFITKMRFLYSAIDASFSSDVCYAWVTYFAVGKTPNEVRNLTARSNSYWFNYNKYEKITWESPGTIKSKSGVLKASYKTGLRIMPEMINLYNTLMDNGIEVYVCSASFIDIIFETATNPQIGLNAKPSNIYAMMLQVDSEGKYTTEFHPFYVQTQGKGKTVTIDKYIKPNHGGRDPIFIAGDSVGDYNMMVDYKNMDLGLIINRVKSDNIGVLSKKAAETIGQKDAKYVLQGRDENTGLFIPTQSSILLGETEEKLVNPKLGYILPKGYVIGEVVVK